MPKSSVIRASKDRQVGYVKRIPKDRVWAVPDGVPLTSDIEKAHVFDNYADISNLALEMHRLGWETEIEDYHA